MSIGRTFEGTGRRRFCYVVLSHQETTHEKEKNIQTTYEAGGAGVVVILTEGELT